MIAALKASQYEEIPLLRSARMNHRGYRHGVLSGWRLQQPLLVTAKGFAGCSDLRRSIGHISHCSKFLHWHYKFVAKGRNGRHSLIGAGVLGQRMGGGQEMIAVQMIDCFHQAGRMCHEKLEAVSDR